MCQQSRVYVTRTAVNRLAGHMGHVIPEYYAAMSTHSFALNNKRSAEYDKQLHIKLTVFYKLLFSERLSATPGSRFDPGCCSLFTF